MINFIATNLDSYFSLYKETLKQKQSFYRTRFYLISYGHKSACPNFKEAFDSLKSSKFASFANIDTELSSIKLVGLDEFVSKTIKKNLCGGIPNHPKLTEKLESVCSQYQIADMGMETFIVNIFDHFTEFFYNTKLFSDPEFVRKVQASTLAMNALLETSNEDLYSDITVAKKSLKTISVLLASCEILFYAAFGMLLVVLMIRHARKLARVSAWCLNLFKSPIASKNDHFSLVPTNKLLNNSP